MFKWSECFMEHGPILSALMRSCFSFIETPPIKCSSSPFFSSKFMCVHFLYGVSSQKHVNESFLFYCFCTLVVGAIGSSETLVVLEINKRIFCKRCPRQSGQRSIEIGRKRTRRRRGTIYFSRPLFDN